MNQEQTNRFLTVLSMILAIIIVLTLTLCVRNATLSAEIDTLSKKVQFCEQILESHSKNVLELNSRVNNNTEIIRLASREIADINHDIEPIFRMLETTNQKLMDILERWGE